MSFDFLEFICAESLLDEPTEFICGCGGDIVQRIDEEDLFCWGCCTGYKITECVTARTAIERRSRRAAPETEPTIQQQLQYAESLPR